MIVKERATYLNTLASRCLRPPRDDGKQTLDDALTLGIKVNMITGDRRLLTDDHRYIGNKDRQIGNDCRLVAGHR